MSTTSLFGRPVPPDVPFRTSPKRTRRYHAAPLRERFMSHVHVSESGCWEWTGARSPKGYGSFAVTKGRGQIAHRVSWWLFVGPIPDGACVLHRCDNPPCVNPDHLFLGSRADNNRDMAQKGRHAAHQGTGVFLRGEAHHASRLSEQDVREIRAAYVPGRRLGGASAIARRLGVSRSTILRAATRKGWAHV